MCLLLSDASIPSNYYINFLVLSSTSTMSLLQIDLNRQNCDYRILQHSIPGGPLAVAPQLHLQRSPVRFVRSVKIFLCFSNVFNFNSHLRCTKRFQRSINANNASETNKNHFLLTQKPIFIASITK